MKRKLLWLPFLQLLLVAAFCGPIKEIFIKEVAVNKNISYAVYKGSNYSTEIYNKAFVQVHIIVEKVAGKKRSIVWEKTLDAKLLSLFPSLENAFSQRITVANVFDKKEHLEVNYTLTYYSGGSKLQMQVDTVLSAGTNSNNLKISI